MVPVLRQATQSPVRIQTSSGVGTPIMAVTVQQSQGHTSAVVTTQQQLQQLQLQLQQQAVQQAAQHAAQQAAHSSSASSNQSSTGPDMVIKQY